MNKDCLKGHLAELVNLEDTDKVLVLMVADCGAELRAPVIGDKMKEIKSELPIETELTVMSYNDENALLFSKEERNVKKHKSKDLVLCRSKVAKDHVLPSE